MRNELNENLKKAIKAQDKPRISTLRLINAAIKDRDIAVRSEENTEGVSDQEILVILSNMVKQRKHSITQYEEGGRIELAEREREEIKIIKDFLPTQLTEEETHLEIHKIISAKEDNNILAETDYGVSFPSVLCKDNILGTQFHPEKSQKEGVDFLKKFLMWKP